MRQRTEQSEGFDYQVERSNEQWTDHVARTLTTAGLIAWMQPRSVLDPACGDGSIVLKSMRLHNPERVKLTDVSIPSISRLIDSKPPGHVTAKVADIEEEMATDERFEMIVLTETLEHFKDPDAILRRAHQKATLLVASSPEMRPGQQDDNPEHLWMFDGQGYNMMLREAGWFPFQKTHLAFPQLPYDFQIWVCRA